MEEWRNNCCYIYGNARTKEKTYYKIMKEYEEVN